MSLPLEFHPEFDTDAEAAAVWYERQQPGLGVALLDEASRVLARIEANPASYGFVERDVREGALKRFSYVIYYRVLRNRIRVLALWHTSRDPDGWKWRT